MADPLRIAVVVGEDSGDQLGAALIDAIRRRRPAVEFIGVAGARMQARGMTSIFPLGDVAVMGVGSVLPRLPWIVRRGYQTVAAVLRAKPDVLVIIDSPGFTHGVAKRVARQAPRLPIIDYVSPSVWAWRPGRAQKMIRYIDHVLALLPFEPAVYERLGGPPCTYVGHPLIEQLDELRPASGKSEVGARPVLLVLPGSRRSELARLMPPFGEAVRLILEKRPEIEILLPVVSHLRDEIETGTRQWPARPTIIEGETAKFAAFRRADAALAASGTVTLELGLCGTPMVVAYRLDPLARLLKPLISAASIVLPNLILGKKAVPEFVDGEATPKVLAARVLELLTDGKARADQVAALNGLPAAMRLAHGTPSDKAAAIVIEAAENGAGRRQRRLEIGT